jgi:cytidyltransferase-like protein
MEWVWFAAGAVVGALGMHMSSPGGWYRGRFSTALTVGCFDLTHRGHAALFRHMARHAARQVVFVHDDASYARLKGSPPALSESVRASKVAQLLPSAEVRLVRSHDPSGVVQAEVRRLVREGTPAGEIVFIRGNDMWHFPGSQTCREEGVSVLFTQYSAGISTTMLKAEARLRSGGSAANKD